MVLVGRNSMSENWRIAFELSLLFVTSSFVVVSKTVTTAETMLVARIISEWIPYGLGPSAVAKHMLAVSTNLVLVEKFDIDPNKAFAFGDWLVANIVVNFYLFNKSSNLNYRRYLILFVF
ncbi:glucose-6-phosphate isomerase, cytosolic-like isoform X1 [Lotus japonicus]|uniref:glucose-6-phosphate isomerase, cytosolic-like isoform X1 n=1 Tax=Lotus japonicus TaxID=34305 RepID=UPI002585B64A|nr:glucose-6-phosphate isomerase, cytosolic-like isoform X1 [Lotus japonicus]